MLGEFAVENAKLGREICLKLKIDKVETKCGVCQIITIICVTYVQKNLKIWTLIKHLFTKYQFFKEIAPNFTYLQKS